MRRFSLRRRIQYLVAWTILASALTTLHAHDGETSSAATNFWSSWNFEPGVVIPLLLSGACYALGMRRLPKQFREQALLFGGGWFLLATALLSPIHRWGGGLFSIHMTQHELLMVGAAPLLILGRPGIVILRAFPPRLARQFVAWSESTRVAAAWRTITRPAVAWLVHAFALWAWHIPSWFEATLHHEWIHVVQHLSFFWTALWFWHSVFRGPRRAADYGWGIVNLFFTAVHSSVLGALITFAPRAWYRSYEVTAPNWGLSGLEDQQLGGLVMWVPADLVYVLAALALLAGWLRAKPQDSTTPFPRASPASSPPITSEV